MAADQLLNRFYIAFSTHNGAGMRSCYHPEVVFSDPAFGTLKGPEVMAMWEMLLVRSKGKLDVVFDVLQEDEKGGEVAWTASYVYTATGRKVINHVTGHFQFQDGLIISHRDHFSMWLWARQAMGLPGLLLGFTPMFRKAFQKRAKQLLADYQTKKKN